MIIFVLGMFIVCAIASLAFILNRFHRFFPKDKFTGRKKGLSWLLEGIPVLGLILYCVFDLVNGVVVTFNLAGIWLLADFIGWIIKKITKKSSRFYLSGAIAVCFTIVYLAVGWYLAHHVYETDYTIKTAKDIGTESLRVIQISDSHLGATFDGEGFAKHMETIQKTNPDMVVVTGDFVDDDSTKEDMIRSCKALGDMKTKYGVYFVYGNHDKGYMNYRDFDNEDLQRELTKNNIKILEDENVLIGDKIYLVGRQDRSEPVRKSMTELTDGLDYSKYIIVLDHQPHDYDAQERAQVDLVLSGHTHGGQMIPLAPIGKLSGANDKEYGLEQRGVTNFIVNSGIADWAIKYKTGTIAEFGVIDIVSE